MPALRNLTTFLVVSSLSFTVLMGLGGCQQKSSEQVVADTSANSADTDKSVDKVKLKNTQNNAITQSTTINYDTPSWGGGDVKRIALSDTDAIFSVLDKPKDIDENSLDFDSSPATKYRHMANDEPYLDIVDSANYFEIDWYYANPNDSDSEKKTSISHAKKAYLLARHVMGDQGGNLVKQMLSGQTIKDKDVSGVKVALAKCEFYSCMLVLDKRNSLSSK